MFCFEESLAKHPAQHCDNKQYTKEKTNLLRELPSGRFLLRVSHKAGHR